METMETAPSNGSEKESLRDVSLKHLVLAILSMAASNGHGRVPITAFYNIFADIVERFPGMFPGLAINRTPNYAYSKRLDSALQDLVGYTVEVPNPELQSIEIKEDVAISTMAWFEEHYGTMFINSLKPVVARFINQLESAA